MYSIDLAKLGVLDSLDGNLNGRINLRQAASAGSIDHWFIQFGDLGWNPRGVHIACAGDLDKDGQQDYSVSLKHERSRNRAEYRSTVILLMYADLGMIDGLDGDVDQNLDVSVLWTFD